MRSSVNVKQAVAVGYCLAVIFGASIAARFDAPLFTFISNFAFVLWVALLVGFGMLAIERHRSRHTVAR